VEEGRCIEYKLSLAPFFSLFLFVYSGWGRQPTYMKRRREKRGFPDIKVSRQSEKATKGSNISFGHSIPPVRACCHAGKSQNLLIIDNGGSIF